MAVEDGVVAPVIHNADKIALGEIAVQRTNLADRARGGKLRPDDLATAPSRSAISACSAWMLLLRLSFRRKPRFSPWEPLPIELRPSTAIPPSGP